MDKLKDLFNNFDLLSLLPELGGVTDKCALAARIAVLIGPACLLFLGLWYLLLPPREANYSAGFRCFRGMGSVEAWRFTQKLAGILWSAMGLVMLLVMFFLSRGYQAMGVNDALLSAVKALLWETGLVAVSGIAIRIVLLVRYDLMGNRRGQEAEL